MYAMRLQSKSGIIAGRYPTFEAARASMQRYNASHLWPYEEIVNEDTGVIEHSQGDASVTEVYRQIALAYAPLVAESKRMKAALIDAPLPVTAVCHCGYGDCPTCSGHAHDPNW